MTVTVTVNIIDIFICILIFIYSLISQSSPYYDNTNTPLIVSIVSPIGRYSIINMPLDSKTHRNLGYSFIQFSTVNDLIIAYENVLIPFSSYC